MKFYGIFILIIMSILCYIIGLSIGTTQGFQTGYYAGLKDGNSSGYIHGFNIGNETGYILGFNHGRGIGYNDGYSSGYNDGYTSGYLKGVKDGAGRGYTIRDPTYQEMLSFIAMDQTDKNQYIRGKYECVHFASDVKNNAFNRGYRCGFVLIYFPNGGHAIVCFNTTDRGLIFIEPQDDSIVEISIGRLFFDRSRYHIDFNDTVVNYLIIW
ncbi:MAG: hypothetical protein NZ922_00940 [Candidatus Methanomethyliaceae archaeon]|nr:hypothetical protein [Candidatus Methanomethyliaceae archaeon]MDW7970257.1 hypothetical protein [Nitrososphaerota archaeon]